MSKMKTLPWFSKKRKSKEYLLTGDDQDRRSTRAYKKRKIEEQTKQEQEDK